MLFINPKYWIIVFKLSSCLPLWRTNKYILGIPGKYKHQVPFSGDKTPSRNQGNKQKEWVRVKGNTINCEVNILDMFKYSIGQK